MTARRASLPSIGPRPGTHAAAAALKREAQDMLDDRNAQKRAAALKSAEADTSAANVARARREGWSDGKIAGQHTPGQ